MQPHQSVGGGKQVAEDFDHAETNILLLLSSVDIWKLVK